jgi:mannosyl-3-phosphoglycerate phosphatase family protein
MTARRTQQPDPCRLVFTDLDGSLLDHDSYSYEAARGQLRALEQGGIPLIPATSKTRAEIEDLRDQLGNEHPFIVENGAAIFIPRDYFSCQPETTRCSGEYWVAELVAGREHWLQLLRSLDAAHRGKFEFFHRAGVAGVSAMTGLDEAAAARANQRAYSEPVQWLGNSVERTRFIADLVRAGASVSQGGRFLSVSGDCDKGRALEWLRAEYARQWGCDAIKALAIGDSLNDCAMLETADSALVVRSPAHDFPPLRRTSGVLYSEAPGPAGWAEGVAAWLHAAGQ